jgi:hypothetical protein
MKDFSTKADLLVKLQDELDDYIWGIFYRWVKEAGINFNNPDWWQISDFSIHFHGSDGCMGCYDPMTLNIPIGFFINPDIAFAELKTLRAKAERDKADATAAAKKKEELAEYHRLQKKFGSGGE